MALVDLNFGSALEAIADLVSMELPVRVAIVQGATQRSWADLDTRASALAGHLVDSGVKAGDRVGIGLYNSIEYFEALLATFKLRGVPVNINYRYLAPELDYVLSYTDARAVIVDGSLERRMCAVARSVSTLRAVIVAGDRTDQPCPDLRGVSFAPFDEAVKAPPLPRQERAVADHIILLTGGTTGQPKGVVWEHSGVASVVLSAYKRMGLTAPTDQGDVLREVSTQLNKGTAPVVLPASPLVHGTGFFSTLGNLLLGGQVVCLTQRSFDAAELWREVAGRRVNEIAIVGDAFGLPMLGELDRAVAAGSPYDLASLDRIVSSGMPWSVEVKKRFLRAGRMTLHDAIASTEGGPYGVSVVGPDEESPSSRFALPPNARVIGDDGTDVEAGSGRVGQLATSNNVALGYLNDPERTARVFRTINGVRYVIPGDAARVDADGTLILLGRGSEVINTGGEKVFAEEVEEVLLRHATVEEAVVVGVPDERWGTRVTALVIPAAGKHPTPEELSFHVGAALAAYKRPRQIFFVNSLERSISGRVDRHRAQALAARLASAAEELSPIT
jgi:fatty-acyl-CoA synthase